MKNILDFTKDELAVWLEEKGIRPFRAGQIFKWLYIKQADGFDQMTDISKRIRLILKKNFYLPRLALEEKKTSSDTTEKFLFRLKDKNHIESVLIPGKKNCFTLCVSSQVGCAQGCKFCLTGKGGFRRNLEVSEIISQVRDSRYYLLKKDIDPLKLSNIVFMGMGEPLANYDSLVKAIKIITDSNYGLKFSSRRVTVSTSGLIPNIKRLKKDTGVNIAISLNATREETRSMLMPVSRKYTIKNLLKACKSLNMKPRDKITFEYILIKGINDSEKDAIRLAKMLLPIKAKVNLIPFNEYDESEFKKPEKKKISDFLQILLDRNLIAIARKSKGDDILAACGQLKARLD